MIDWLWLLIGLTVGVIATWILARRVNAANAARIDALEATADKARQAAEKLRRENESTKDAAAEAKRLRSELAAAHAKLADATGPLASRIEALEADVARRDKRIVDYRAEIDEREHALVSLRARVAAHEGTAEPASDPTAEVAAELGRVQARLAEAESRAAAAAKRAEDEAAKLAREKADSHKHQARVLELKQSVDHLTARFAERNRAVQALEDALRAREAGGAASANAGASAAPPTGPADLKAANAELVAAYRHDMLRKDRRIAELEAALAKARAKRPGPQGAGGGGDTRGPAKGGGSGTSSRATSASEAAAKPAAPAPEAPAPAATADPAKPAPAAHSSGARDDLTRIKGIGKVFAGRLEAAGIRTFAALAARDAAELEAIVEPKAWQAIDFAAWIAEARALAEG